MVMLLALMMLPDLIWRLGVLAFVALLIVLMGLLFFGTDFGKGAVRWYLLGFASFQLLEFLKLAFVVLVVWMIVVS